MESFIKRVSAVQQELKAPKNQVNRFGGYNYRSCEDILEAAKPLCAKHGIVLNLSDQVEQIGDRYYVTATARLLDIESQESIFSTASAREAEAKKGMDESQITGTASSYARKYALNGLLNIDDTKDADTDEYTARGQQSAPRTRAAAPKSPVYKCCDCGREFRRFTDKTGKTWEPQEIYESLVKASPDDKARCAECRKKAQG